VNCTLVQRWVRIIRYNFKKASQARPVVQISRLLVASNFVRTRRHSWISRSLAQLCTHACSLLFTHVHNTHIHARTHTYTHAHTHTHIHTRTHIHLHTLTRKHARTRTTQLLDGDTLVCVVALRNVLAHSNAAKAAAVRTGLHSALLSCCLGAARCLEALQRSNAAAAHGTCSSFFACNCATRR